MFRKFIGSFIAFQAILFSCSGGGSNDSKAFSQSFSDGVNTYEVSGTNEANESNAVVRDQFGAEILSLEVSGEKATLRFPGVPGETVISFDQPGTIVPSSEVTAMAILTAAQVYLVKDSWMQTDHPGCDLISDKPCRLPCCAVHDKCYFDNNCSFDSWIPGLGSAECKACNKAAYDCIQTSCAEGAPPPSTTNNCYDNTCDTFYQCADGKCDCESPCSTGVSECCVETNNCPSEQLFFCESDCCCCPWGSVCGSGHQCTEPVSGYISDNTSVKVYPTWERFMLERR